MKFLLILISLGFASSALAQETNVLRSRDYAAFKIVPERNIFNPNRTARGANVPKTEEKPAKVDSFALVGTMSYEKGNFAFFDGSSAEFRKVLSPTNSIAGYTLREVGENSVKLEKDGKTTELVIGQQLKRQNEGDWTISAATSYSAPSSSESSSSTKSDASSSATESDVLKRLREKREKESGK
jgi:prepilin-type processing-associated H-X9-DG protein